MVCKDDEEYFFLREWGESCNSRHFEYKQKNAPNFRLMR